MKYIIRIPKKDKRTERDRYEGVKKTTGAPPLSLFFLSLKNALIRRRLSLSVLEAQHSVSFSFNCLTAKFKIKIKIKIPSNGTHFPFTLFKCLFLPLFLYDSHLYCFLRSAYKLRNKKLSSSLVQVGVIWLRVHGLSRDVLLWNWFCTVRLIL